VLPESELAAYRAGILFVGQKVCCWPTCTSGNCCPSRSSRTSAATDRRTEGRGFELEPASLPHYHEWLAACKSGSPTSCHFGYGGPLTELSCWATRPTGPARSCIGCQESPRVNCPQADRFLRGEYRQGWTLGSVA